MVDDAPKEPETNYYRKALKDARDEVRGVIDGLTPDEGSLGDNVLKHVVSNGGWECEEADTWADSLRAERSGILGKFEESYDEFSSAYENEPAEVNAGDARGKAYQRHMT